jgi:glyoxylase-like metal-dependent hydrolase (beta-lactamase superfamily II)
MNIDRRIDLQAPGRLSPEVELVAAPGHTPGHSCFQVNSGEEKLLVFGDAVHLYTLQFPHPEWTMAYDVHPDIPASSFDHGPHGLLFTRKNFWTISPTRR